MELIIASILFISTILPSSSTITESLLEDVFHTFLEACRIFGELQLVGVFRQNDEIILNIFKSKSSTSKNISNESQNSLNTTEENDVLKGMILNSFRFSLMNLFHILYGIFPCNTIFLLR